MDQDTNDTLLLLGHFYAEIDAVLNGIAKQWHCSFPTQNEPPSTNQTKQEANVDNIGIDVDEEEAGSICSMDVSETFSSCGEEFMNIAAETMAGESLEDIDWAVLVQAPKTADGCAYSPKCVSPLTKDDGQEVVVEAVPVFDQEEKFCTAALVDDNDQPTRKLFQGRSRISKDSRSSKGRARGMGCLVRLFRGFRSLFQGFGGLIDRMMSDPKVIRPK